jgi:hypothetical protein
LPQKWGAPAAQNMFYNYAERLRRLKQQLFGGNVIQFLSSLK